MGRLIRNPKTPAPTKFHTPTAIRKAKVHLWGIVTAFPHTSQVVRLTRMKSHASNVRGVSGTTSKAENMAASAMVMCDCLSGGPKKRTDRNSLPVWSNL